MRFLGVGDTCDLGALYLRLLREGHEVKVCVGEPLARGTLAGMVEHVADWRDWLPWVRAAGSDGIILFENVAHARGLAQDSLRADGFNVVGGSAYGDRLENDRAFAQRALADLGLPVLRVETFSSVEEADRHLDRKRGPFVLKFNGPGFSSADTFVGRCDNHSDIRAILRAKRDTLNGGSFVLMERADGVEMGVGAYFNGERFLGRACLDWEHKRFFPGDLGEMTGEMGTVATFDRSGSFFERTLAKMAPLLRQGRYCGYINLNTIVNERGIWPLEFTCRFGYPGFAVLDPLQETPWADLFKALVTRADIPFVTRSGFSVGLVMTTRPFPYTRKDIDEPVGMPVLFDGALSEEEARNVHVGEVGMANGALATSGVYGWTMVLTGVGATIAQAQRKALALADRAIIPHVRYRRDIGDKLLAGDWTTLEKLRLLDAAEITGPA